LPDVEDQVRTALSEKLVAPKISASLIQIAPTIPGAQGTITLTGAVARVGPIPLEEGLRVYKAVELAGGATRGADLGRIGILHRDLSRTSTDLSTSERISNPLHNLLLKDGDSVDIPSRPIRTASIRGAVARPGLVELPGEIRLWAALDLVGGLTRDADLHAVTIRHADLTRSTIDLSDPEKLADPARNVLLRDGETVEIPLLAVALAPTIREPQVRIRGNVLNPGRYPFQPDMELIDLIETAGKLVGVADPTQIQLQRGDQVRVIDLVEQEKKGFDGKLLLLAGDEVYVPEHRDRVILIGAVPKYGPMPLKPGQTIREFFTQGGADLAAALNPSAADLKKVQVIRRGQEPVVVNLHSLILKPEDKKAQDLVLAAGDVVYIPPRVPRGPRGPLGYLSQLGPLAFLFSIF
jgi:protein involved in polysaccharide export with SLBB domain